MRGKKWKSNILIKKLKELNKKLGRAPSRGEARIFGLPSNKAYRNHFGTWSDAIRKSGEEPLKNNRSFLFRKKNKKVVIYPKERIPESLRFRIFLRDNFKCQYCGRTIEDGIRLDCDHIVPVSKGGKTEMNNLITSCHICNIGKKDILVY